MARKKKMSAAEKAAFVKRMAAARKGSKKTARKAAAKKARKAATKKNTAHRKRKAAAPRKRAASKVKRNTAAKCKRRSKVTANAGRAASAKRRLTAAESRRAVEKAAKARRKKNSRKVTMSNHGRKTVKRKRNSGGVEAAAERFEYFHGKQPEVMTEVSSKVIEHDTLSGIGYLKKLYILTDTDFELEYEGFGDALLAQDIGGGQLYIIGGKQRVNLEDFDLDDDGRQYYALGALHRVWYDTEKLHLRPEDGGKAIYDHEFGENGGRLPIVIYDALNEQLILAGGSYSLPSVGIDD